MPAYVVNKKFFNDFDSFAIAEALNAIRLGIPVPSHVEKEFNNHDSYLVWLELSQVVIPGGMGQVAIQFEDEGSNLGIAGTVDEVDFVGAIIAATRVGNKVTVTVSGNVPTQYEDEGSNLGTAGTVNEVDFVGAGVSATRVGNKVTVTIAGAPASNVPIQFEDEGSNLGTAGTVDEIDFVGAGITAARVGNKITVTVPGGAGADITDNATFVDTAFGNDGTGVINNFTKKFATLGAAIAATASGSVIYVFPGTYNENINLWKDGITFYFLPGVIISNGFFTGVTGESCNVFGEAKFAKDTNIITMSTGGTFFIQCDELKCTGASNAILVTAGDVNLSVQCNRILSTGKGIRISSMTAGSNILIRAAEYFSCSGQSVYLNGIVNGNINIYSPRATATSGTVIEIDDSATSTGNINIYFDEMFDTGAGAASIFRCGIFLISSSSVKVKIVGNLTLNDNIIGVSAFKSDASSNFQFIGNITGTSMAMLLDNSAGSHAGTFRFNGRFIGGIGTIGAPYTGVFVIYTGGTDTPNVYINGEVRNTSATGAGVQKVSVPSSTYIIDTVKVLTNGGGSAFNSDTLLDTYKVIHSAARQEANVNMTNSIIGSVDYLDANIQ